MPSKRMVLEWAKHEVEAGRGDEAAHIVDVAKEQRERIANKQRKTRFVLVCDDPDQCSRLEFHKDRVFRKVRNKAILLSLIELAMGEYLSDASLDKLMAKEMADADGFQPRDPGES
jgi:hypothetical protein